MKMGLRFLEDVQEEESSNEEMRKSIFILKQKLKKQSRQSLTWKTKFLDESRLVAKLNAEKQDYLKSIQSQLLVFESHLKRTKIELESIVKSKEGTIHKQHQLICALSLALLKREGHKELLQILPGLNMNKNSDSQHNENNEIVSKNNIKNNFKEEMNEKKTVVISSKTDFESLNDSDSAIMMEDAYDSLIALPAEKGEAKVMRSVSDALEIISRGVSSSLNNKINSLIQVKPGHGSLSSTPSCSSEESDHSPPATINKVKTDLLREEYCWKDSLLQHSTSPLVSSTPSSYYSNNNINNNLCRTQAATKTINSCNKNLCQSPLYDNRSTYISTVVPPCDYQSGILSSFNESPNKTHLDLDSDATLSDGHSDDGDSGFGSRLPHPSSESLPDRKSLFGSYEKLNHIEASYIRKSPREETIQVTYNRVMSNHRSVTKPKDVKYKRINKAKSRSLEELRGKLKLFDGKQSFTIDVGVSDA